MTELSPVSGAAVEASGLSVTYGRHKRDSATIDALDLSVEPGEMLVLLGPSGCGKTTILRCLAGILDPSDGVVRIDDRTVFDRSRGVNLAPNRRGLGMVFQSFALWPHMTVAQNIAYPLKARGIPAAQRSELVDSALRMVHCEQLEARLPGALSGGQQQRVALARALVARPGVMLFDEPLSNLDAALRHDLRNQLRDLHRSMGFSGVYVTHDRSEAIALGTRVAVMRSGRIAQIGDAQSVFAYPQSLETAIFVGMKNVVSIERVDGRWILPSGDDAPYVPAQVNVDDGSVQVAVRPENCHVFSLSDAGGLPETVSPFAYGECRRMIAGGAMEEYLVVLADGTEIDVRGALGRPISEGEWVGVAIDLGKEAPFQRGANVRLALSTVR